MLFVPDLKIAHYVDKYGVGPGLLQQYLLSRALFRLDE